MASVDVLNWSNEKVGSIELAPEVFDIPVRKDVLHLMVRWQLASRRRGTHSTKMRGEVSGGGKKPFKQKGTGNARQGSSRSPLKPGGGITFGPKPRSYEFDVPKKVKQLGLKSALSQLLKSGKLTIVRDMNCQSGKTKEVASALNKMGANKAVLIDLQVDQSFQRAARNLPTFRYYSVDGLNVYDLLKYDRAFLTESSIAQIQTRCGVK